MDNVSANSGYSTYTSQPGPSDKADSTLSSQSSVTSDAEASFAQPILEDLVHSSTILANQDSIGGSNISFEIESSNTPTYDNVNDSQVLVAPEYKEGLRTQPAIAKLTEFEWESVICEQMKRHNTANNIKVIPINVDSKKILGFLQISSRTAQ